MLTEVYCPKYVVIGVWSEDIDSEVPGQLKALGQSQDRRDWWLGAPRHLLALLA